MTHSETLGAPRPLAIYLHIPFCRTKCAYCDFNTYAGIEPLMPAYVEALCKEVRRYPAGLPAFTLNFGGGTPSLLDATQLGAIIAACRAHFDLSGDAEISIEANPDDLDEAYFAAVREAGVNRISFGVQSLHEKELRILTRRHGVAAVHQALEAARRAGFRNLNLDFMYGLPNQTLEGWRATLEGAVACRPEHLSLYALTVHEHLPLGVSIRRGDLPEPDEDLAADMYELAEAMLAGAGYEQYEISNWSLGGAFPCRHNLAYWRNTGYIGLGAGAHSYFQGHRFNNELSPKRYIEKVSAEIDPAVSQERLSKDMQRAESAILGLRLNEGVPLDQDQLARLQDCIDAGLLDVSGPAVRLTAKGRLLSNEVFWRLLPQTSTASG